MPCDLSITTKKRPLRSLFVVGGGQHSMQCISLLRSQAYVWFASFAVPFSKPAEAGENELGTFSPVPRVRLESIHSANRKRSHKGSYFYWRRARDSNPTFAMAGTVENTGIQRLVKMSVFKSVFKKSPAGLFFYTHSKCMIVTR